MTIIPVLCLLFHNTVWIIHYGTWHYLKYIVHEHSGSMVFRIVKISLVIALPPAMDSVPLVYWLNFVTPTFVLNIHGIIPKWWMSKRAGNKQTASGRLIFHIRGDIYNLTQSRFDRFGNFFTRCVDFTRPSRHIPIYIIIDGLNDKMWNLVCMEI